MEEKYDNSFKGPNEASFLLNDQLVKNQITDMHERRSDVWDFKHGNYVTSKNQFWTGSKDANTIEGDIRQVVMKKSNQKLVTKIKDINESQDSSPKKKRLRRTASEISRNWKCVLCNKSYGSEGALKTHSKLKHPNEKSEIVKPQKSSQLPFSIPTSITSIVPSITRINSQVISISPVMKKDVQEISLPNHISSISPNHDLYLKNNENFKLKIGPSTNNHHPYLPYDEQSQKIYTHLNEVDTKLSSDFIPLVYPVEEYHLMDNSREEDTSIITNFDESYNTNEFSLIPILFLSIGQFSKTSYTCGDLICFISFKQRKFYWEQPTTMQSLTRIEIEFDNINSLDVDSRHEEYVVLIFQLSHPPKFWSGWPTHQPVQWTPINDFTGGYASKYRKHVLHFMKSAAGFPLQRLFEVEARFKKNVELDAQNDNLFFGSESSNSELYNTDLVHSRHK